jgi:hypothetical protein
MFQNKTSNRMDSQSNASRHPSMYDLQVANPLISSRAGLSRVNPNNPKLRERKEAPLTVNEFKLVALITYVVRHSPADTKFYSIRYEDVISKGSLQGGNRKKLIDDLRENLHLRFLTLDKKYAAHYITDWKPQEDPSFTPFITIAPEKDTFKLELHPIYKTIIRTLEHGYTRADLETIRTLKTTASNIFYYEVRQRQSMSKRWQVSLDEFRYKLYLDDKYLSWSDLEKRVVKKIQQEYEGKWTEFEYEPVKETKGKVTGILFHFKNGPLEEKDLPAGFDFKFERKLLDYGMKDYTVVRIRNLVKSGEKHKLGFAWDESYVIYTIEAFREALVKRNKNPKLKSVDVKSPGGWLYNALMLGWYVEEVAEKRAKGQLRLDGFSAIKVPSPSLSQAEEFELQEEETDQTETWKNLYQDLRSDPRNTFKSFEEFLASQGKVLVDGKVVHKNK